jgi:Zn-dependent peptidase ImmA (M78 family)/transcriptional regulator with XRE-family HTH domain
MRDEHQRAIGALISRLREQQGWSQRALATWVGIDQSAVSRIEAGHRRLAADELQRFADVLHVSADDLLRGLPAAPHPPGPAPARGSASAPRPAGKSHSYLSPHIQGTDAHDDVDVLLEMSSGTDAGPESGPERAGAYDETFAAPRMRMSTAPEDWRELGSPSPHPDLGALDADQAVPSLSHSLRIDVAGAMRTSPSAGLPVEAAAVARDWFDLRRLSASGEPAQPWSTGHSAEGKPERVSHTTSSLRAGAGLGDVLFDRVARFWRSELHVDPDDGPLPDLVPLLEDGFGAQVIVARVGAGDQPVAAAFSTGDVPFLFVNAARPVVLQRFALAHAFAHLVLGHGDVVDRRIGWNRNVPPEAAANDFAEELLAPVRAVRRWYERRALSRWVRTDDLLELGNAFGISAWAALYRSRAAGRLHGKQFSALRADLERQEWQLLPRQAYLGGLKDTLSQLTPGEALPQGEYGAPAVLRVPAPMRVWGLTALMGGRLSLEDAAALLRLDAMALAEQLALMGLE